METTIELREMRAFVAVVATGSFTAAAERLDTDKARVSRTVSRMEAKLGVQLLVRSTRRLAVTDIGRNYYQRANCILDAADEAEAAVAQQSGEPSGLLKVTAGAEFGTMVVDGWLIEYLRLAPRVSVEAYYTNRLVDIIHEGMDIALRIGELQDSGLSARKLGNLTYGLYASPEYLRNSPTLNSVEELRSHALIMHGRPSWALVHTEKAAERVTVPPRCLVNNSVAAKNFALAGLGVAHLACFVAAPHLADGTLARVLTGWAHPPVPVHALFASSRFMDPKVSSFVELCQRVFPRGESSD